MMSGNPKSHPFQRIVNGTAVALVRAVGGKRKSTQMATVETILQSDAAHILEVAPTAQGVPTPGGTK